MLGLNSYMSTNINLILQYTNITMEELKSRSELYIKRKIKCMNNTNSKSNLVNELLRCRESRWRNGLWSVSGRNW